MLQMIRDLVLIHVFERFLEPPLFKGLSDVVRMRHYGIVVSVPSGGVELLKNFALKLENPRVNSLVAQLTELLWYRVNGTLLSVSVERMQNFVQKDHRHRPFQVLVDPDRLLSMVSETYGRVVFTIPDGVAQIGEGSN